MKNQSKEEYKGEPRFWFIDDLEETPHYEYIKKSMDNNKLMGLVDEKAGGIVAYIIKGNKDILNKFGLSE